MTPEQQNRTIAKHCGWMQSKSSMWEGWWHQTGKNAYQQFCPNYCNDLNAMHEAEKVLNVNEQYLYWIALLETRSRPEDYGDSGDFEAIYATAAQRAEAFLRTLNLWQNEP